MASSGSMTSTPSKNASMGARSPAYASSSAEYARGLQQLARDLLGSVERVGERELLGAHDRAVGRAAQLGLREVLRARVRRRQVLHVVARSAEARERLAARKRVSRVVGRRREHRVDGVVGVTAVAQDALQPADEELVDRGAGARRVELKHALVAGQRRADEVVERAFVPPRSDLQHADGAAPQRERVRRARGRHARGEDARDGVELVGDGDDATRQRRRAARRRRSAAGSARRSPCATPASSPLAIA